MKASSPQSWMLFSPFSAKSNSIGKVWKNLYEEKEEIKGKIPAWNTSNRQIIHEIKWTV